MSRICPECGREYFGRTVKCIHCNCVLIEKSDLSFSQQTRGRSIQQSRQTAAQMNYQRAQQARAEQERARQQQEEPFQTVHIVEATEEKSGSPSGMSITALVFSFLGCLSLVGMILAIIDLCTKNGRKKTCSIIALVVSIVWPIILIVLLSSDSGSDSGTGIAGNHLRNSVSKSFQQDTFGLMETAEMNDVQVRMTDYRESYGSAWNSPSDGKVYVLVEFEISNYSDSDVMVSSLLSFDAYADGYAADFSLGALADIEDEQLDGSIASGMKMRGWIGFEIPEDWKDLEIHFTENVWSSNKFKFLIQK